MSERFRDVAEQAEWLRVSEKTCRRLAARLGAVRVGSRLLFPESGSIEFLKTQSLRPRRARGNGRQVRSSA
jgi:hypothetical protein